MGILDSYIDAPDYDSTSLQKRKQAKHRISKPQIHDSGYVNDSTSRIRNKERTYTP